MCLYMSLHKGDIKEWPVEFKEYVNNIFLRKISKDWLSKNKRVADLNEDLQKKHYFGVYVEEVCMTSLLLH